MFLALVLCLSCSFAVTAFSMLQLRQLIYREENNYLVGLARVLDQHLTENKDFDGILANPNVVKDGKEEYYPVLPDAETIMEKHPELREIAIEKLNKALREYSDIVAQSGSNLGAGYYCKALNAIITYSFQDSSDRNRLLESTKESRKKQGQPEKFSNTLVGTPIHNNHPGRKVMGQKPDENNPGKWRNIVSKEDWKEWNKKYKDGFVALPNTASLVRSGIYNAQYPILARDDNGRIPNTEKQKIHGYIWVNKPSDNVENEIGDKISKILLTTFIVDIFLIGFVTWIFYKTAAVERKAFALSQAAKDSQKNFLAHMSHEIRTPLNGVIGIVGLLDRTQLDDKQKEYVSLLDTSADHLLMLINDILDFSKIEAGKLELEQIPFNITEMLETVVKIVSPKAMEKGIALSYEVARQTLPLVLGDSLRIRQILVNFMNNALKFTKRGSIRMVLSVKNEEERSLLIRFAVIDTGIGIPKDHQYQLFGSFTQVDASSARKYGGTGLGLAISKELVEMMNGTIGVESEEGAGSTFWCEIPFSVADTSSIAKEESFVIMPSQTEGKTKDIKTILVAEDNKVNQIVISETLKQVGLQFDLVGDGQQVLDAVEKNTYSMILMDCHMPIMDGFEATQIIRQRESAATDKHIPIIALTASATKDDKELCLAAGMDDFCTKPIELNKLIRVIRKTLSGTSE